ncbi:methyltransferase [Candidatus Thioglobus sp.]|nr:methyltransferase [Candidatus Thioglobus sp.]
MKEKYKYDIKGKDEVILSLHEDVFSPTGTSEEIIKAVSKNISKPGSLLDLGCGSGIVGFALHRMGVASELYASDISLQAVNLVRKNAKENNIECEARDGAIFIPWAGEKFNYIVDDISGISQEIAEISPWFKNTMCESGKDGADLVIDAIKQASLYLLDGGKFFFPVLSLSNVDRIISSAESNFDNVERLSHKVWTLPDEMKPYLEKLKELKNKGLIKYEEKFGLILWYTDIYVAYNSIKNNME